MNVTAIFMLCLVLTALIIVINGINRRKKKKASRKLDTMTDSELYRIAMDTDDLAELQRINMILDSRKKANESLKGG